LEPLITLHFPIAAPDITGIGARKMENEADNPENVPWHADEQITQCAQGSEIFSPRDLTAYLRLYGEGKKLPPEVEGHLAECRICGENWAFIQRTDPTLKKLRRARVKLLITSILADESALPIPVEPSEEVAEDRPVLVEEMQQALYQPQASTGSDVRLKELLQPVLATGELSSDRVLDTCRTVQGIADDGIRYQASKELSAGFEIRVARDQKRGTIPNNSIVYQLTNNRDSEWVDLSGLGVPLASAMAFVASFAPTSFYRDPNLFQKSGQTILLNVKQLRQLFPKFDEDGSRFEGRQSPKLMD
jgi:hypothetical protein